MLGQKLQGLAPAGTHELSMSALSDIIPKRAKPFPMISSAASVWASFFSARSDRRTRRSFS